MSVLSITWPQVSAWRMAQHGLNPRLPMPQFIEAARRTGGIQAQVMSAAELALSARVDGLAQQDVQSALWQDRTLVKTWAMRATLHLLPAADLPLNAAARSLYAGRNWDGYFEFFGISPDQSAAFLDAIPQVLGAEPVTRQQLATAVAQYIGSPDLAQKLLTSSWGSMWKPSAWRGDLCFGPNQGRNVTFVRPSAWFGQWQEVDPYQAAQEIARRYLRSYGPTTPDRFGLWWGVGITLGRKVFQSIQDELEQVEVEGWQALALRADLEAMRATKPSQAVRLLPLFDTYVLGLARETETILPQAYRKLVYRPQGWISAVVLAGGTVKGVWEMKSHRDQLAIQVRPFSSPDRYLQDSIEAEASRMGAFLRTGVVLEWDVVSGGG